MKFLRAISFVFVLLPFTSYGDTYQRGNIDCRNWGTFEDPETPAKALPLEPRIEGKIVWIKETGEIIKRSLRAIPDPKSNGAFPKKLKELIETDLKEGEKDRACSVQKGSNTVTCSFYLDLGRYVEFEYPNSPPFQRLIKDTENTNILNEYLGLLGGSTFNILGEFADSGWLASAGDRLPFYWRINESDSGKINPRERQYDLLGGFQFRTGTTLALQWVPIKKKTSFHFYHKCEYTPLP